MLADRFAPMVALQWMLQISALASSAGVGGGAFFVPLFMVCLGFGKCHINQNGQALFAMLLILSADDALYSIPVVGLAVVACGDKDSMLADTSLCLHMSSCVSPTLTAVGCQLLCKRACQSRERYALHLSAVRHTLWTWCLCTCWWLDQSARVFVAQN